MAELDIDPRSIEEALAGTSTQIGTTTAEVTYQGDINNIACFSLKQGKHEIGRARLEALQGQPWVVSGDLYVHDDWRGQGIAKILDKLKIAMCKDSGKYGMLASVFAGNIPQMKRMLDNGWRSVHYTKEHHLFIKTVDNYY